MSTATEYAPSIRIPDRARPRRTAAVVLPFPYDRIPRAAVSEAPPLRVAVAPRGEARPIRLTRRGWAVAVLAVGIALAGALWLAQSSAMASSAPHRSPPSTVVVRPQRHVVVDRDAYRPRPRPARGGVRARATQ